MKKNHTNLFTPSLLTLSIYEIIYAALFKDYPSSYLVKVTINEIQVLAAS